MRTQDSSPQNYTHSQLLEQFRLFDKDNDGFIERSEMIDIVKELRLGRFFPVTVIDQLFREADVDGDGKISFQGRKKTIFMHLLLQKKALMFLEFATAVK